MCSVLAKFVFVARVGVCVLHTSSATPRFHPQPLELSIPPRRKSHCHMVSVAAVAWGWGLRHVMSADRAIREEVEARVDREAVPCALGPR